MGQSSSALPSANPHVPYFAVTFETPDRLVLALADDSVVDLTRSAIKDATGEEFLHYESRTEANFYTFKFRGLPFRRGCGLDNRLKSKRICCRLLEQYYNNGWKLALASDLSRAKELTTWFFRRRQHGPNGPISNGGDGRRVICVSVDSTDLIGLVNAPEHLRHLLVRTIRDTSGAEAIKTELVYDDEFEVQMSGTPWTTQDALAGVRARRLLLDIVRRLETAGYQFYGTVNTKGSSDSLFFISAEQKSADDESGDDYFAISLNQSNCLRVIDADDDALKLIVRAVLRYWPWKLQSRTTIDAKTEEFKLAGNPWWATGGEEATAARIFLCGMLETLHSAGWRALTALDVTRRLNDKAVLVLRRQRRRSSALLTPGQRSRLLLDDSVTNPYWCISLHDQSKLRMIGAPEPLRAAVRNAIQQVWPWGIQRESDEPRSHGYEFKLRGGKTWGAEQQQTTALMCYLLKALGDNGWMVTLSADVTGRYISNNHGGSHSLDVHSLFVTLANADPTLRRPSSFALRPLVGNSPSLQHVPEVGENDDDDDDNDNDDNGKIRLERSDMLRRPSDILEALAVFPPKPAERPCRKISAVEYTSYVVNSGDENRPTFF